MNEFIYIWLFETGSYYAALAGLKLFKQFFHTIRFIYILKLFLSKGFKVCFLFWS